MEPYRFDRIYGGWWTPVLRSGAWEIVRSSALRYIEHLEGVALGAEAEGPGVGGGVAAQFVDARGHALAR